MIKEYFYLDDHGIESLYVQTVELLEVEKSSTIERSIGGKGSIKLAVKQKLISWLAGAELEGAGEISGSRRRSEESRFVRKPEHMLNDLIRSLEKLGEPAYFEDLARAAKYTSQNKNKTFVTFDDEFDAPQFHGGAAGAELVNASGYLMLEKGQPGSYNPRDDYYKRPQIRLTMAASLSKLRRTRGKMAHTGHDAIFLRHHDGRRVPLTVFGSLSMTADVFQVKPYAIWR